MDFSFNNALHAGRQRFVLVAFGDVLETFFAKRQRFLDGHVEIRVSLVRC